MWTFLSYTRLSLPLVWLSNHLLLESFNQLCGPKPQRARTLVWAYPGSLAATTRITFVFSSSGYLDVSVHRVPISNLCIGLETTGFYTCQVSPFRYLWITGYLHLPKAFRSLSRLSSALSAKASTLRSYSLNHQVNLSIYFTCIALHAWLYRFFYFSWLFSFLISL